MAMGWGSIYRRRLKVFTVALMVYFDYKTVQQREKWVKNSKRAALWERAHERNARRVLDVILQLEGMWVKFGQYMSTRADVLPMAYINLLKQLQDSLPPRPLQEVSHTIEQELGKSMNELFRDFVETPLATASVAQVHRATLHNGQDVVVKVQHHGIKRIILEDLKNAKSIVDWIAWAEPLYDFNPLIDEWCREAPRELDFNIEAENTRTVAKSLGCRKMLDGDLTESTNMSSNQVNVLIPEVIQSTEKVLILEYMDGIRLNDNQSLEAFGVDKQKLVEEITRAYAHQIYVDGFFNGDPHPGNFLVSKEPPHRPILLDFGLTKKLSTSMKRALAKMFLASTEGDYVGLLSAFSEMGLKLRLDMPEQAMEVATAFFRATTPANEALENMRSMAEKTKQNLKIIQEKMELSQKEVKRFNPIDAFPGDIIIFGRVINLLRGLSSTMNLRIVYRDIMKPFAESVLLGNIDKGLTVDTQWIYDTPVHSDVEAKLRKLLVDLGRDQKILGIQVCAYKDGDVIIDTAAGLLGRYDPRPVQPDSLFPIFSATKGITAAMLHWLVDKGKINLNESVANIWPEFGTNGKDLIKVYHVLNHTSGLHNALADINRENPLLMSDWDECLKRIANAAPETEPGQQQLYHYLSFGWLCGGIIEHASGKKFQKILEEAFVHPLQVEGELYIGIPPGVESRLASLTVDMDDIQKLSGIGVQSELPSSFQPENIIESASTLPAFFNMLNIRRAILPAANGHCSARALARFYAALVSGGIVPPPHSSSSKPPLGRHPHIPQFASKPISKNKKQKGAINRDGKTDSKTTNNARRHNFKDDTGCDTTRQSDGYLVDSDITSQNNVRIFTNPRIHDEFVGIGDYESLVIPGGQFGLGFRRITSKDGSLIGFGHSGMGGTTAFCDIKNRFSIAVTLNKMSLGTVTRTIVDFVCSELNIPCPQEFSRLAEMGINAQLNMEAPLIN